MKPEQTAAMIKVAGKGPHQRKSEIDQTRAEAGYGTQRFNDWGVKIDPEMVISSFFAVAIWFLTWLCSFGVD